MNRAALRYMCGVSATFWCVLAVLVSLEVGALHPMWQIWLPLLGLAMMAEAFEVGTASEAAGGVMSFSAAAHIAAVILLGPVLAAFVAATAVVLVDGVRAQRPVVVAVNSAMFGWASLVAGAVYVLAGGHTGGVSSAWGAALVAVVVTRYAVNAVVYAVGASLATGAPVRLVVREKLLEGASAGLGEGSLGVLLAAGWSTGRWITLPFLLPLFAALYASKSNLERLRQETAAALNAFARVIDERDPNTARHTERVAGYVRRFVDAVGLPPREADRLVQAAQYHDLGKIAIDEATLSKSGRLSEAEVRAIRRHPRLSAKLLEPYGFAREIARYVELHHERYDGRGYYGVPAQETGIEAHVLIVADSFDAMTSTRAYRPALSVEEATRELLEKAGTQFHPLVARAFAAVIEDRDVRDALSREELAELLGAFEPISALPRPQLAAVREPRIALACLTGGSMIAVAIMPDAVLRACTLAAAAAAGVLLGGITVRERQRMMSALRRVGRGDGLEAALASGGVEAESRWLLWNAGRDAYAGDPGGGAAGDEVAVRAGLLSGAEPVRLRDGRFAVFVDHEANARVAVLLPQKPSSFEVSLIRRTARRAQPPAGVQVVRADPDRPADGALTIVARLEAFERIRRAAGQLTAARCVREARVAVESLLRASDSVTVRGDDELVIRLADASEADAEPICARIAAVLARVAVPQRVEPIAARVRVERPGWSRAVGE
jgi:hypothetical protein